MFLDILSELMNKCVIEFGRFVRISNKNGRKGSLFSMFIIIELCVSLNFFFQVNGIAGFGGVNLLALPTKARILCLDSL